MVLCAVVALLALLPVPVRAQGVLRWLNLDRLRLTRLGIAAGPVAPVRIVPTTGYAIEADYGEIVPRLRVGFSASYWGSRYTDETVDEFARQLRAAIIDPSGDDTITVGRVRLQDIALELELRWTPVRAPRFVQPYAGGGIGAHVLNAEASFIDNTFIESALDQIVTGFTGFAGVETGQVGRFTADVQARYTLLSAARYGALRFGVRYRFRPPRAAAGS